MMDVLAYLDRSIATYDGDPPSNDYQRGCLDTLKVARAEMATISPIPMLLFCPRCHAQHVDEADPANGWENPPHRSHLCHECGCIWRPADVPTVGAARIETRGRADTWPPPPIPNPPHHSGGGHRAPDPAQSTTLGRTP